ncbi:hypothetical protein [Bacteroides nordii]|uniref:hypothetical protein n=1 Tax=Bacteroides nordii TaxID=291645 RepID=UPI003522C24C
MKKQHIYLDELKKFIYYIENLSEADINKLESNKYTIKYSLIPTVEKYINSNEKMDFIEIDNIINILNGINSREEGESFLISKKMSRSELESIARRMDIPLSKKDNIAKIMQKIIESTIGFRLNSQAIQSNHNV